MNSTSVPKNYRHDILGKLPQISVALSCLNDAQLSKLEKAELFHAVHEVILKMVRTSRNTIRDHLPQKNSLTVSDRSPDTGLQRLDIEGLKLRFSLGTEGASYILYTQENLGSLVFQLGKAFALLPIQEVLSEIEDLKLQMAYQEAYEALISENNLMKK